MRYIIFFFVILIVLCCPFPLKISCILEKSKFKFQIYTFHIHKKNNKKQAFNFKKNNNQNTKHSLMDSISLIEKNIFIIKYMTKKYFKKSKLPFLCTRKAVKCSVKLNVIYGFDDPCYTATFYPALIAILTELQIYSFKYFKYKKFSSTISPNFNKKILNIVFLGIFYITLGKIIHISFLALKAIIIYKSRGGIHGTSN